jgi:site-specific DNA recombinase
MGKLDSLVTSQLVERLFCPERLANVLSSLTACRAEKAQTPNDRVPGLRREVTGAEEKLKRLYRLVEEGVTDLDDVLKDRLSNLKAERDRAKAALDRAGAHAVPIIQIDPARIQRFGELMRHNLTNGSVPFRKAYLRSIIDTVEVDDTCVRIKGNKDILERAVLADSSGDTDGSQMSTSWRARGDSNPPCICHKN